MKGRELGVDQQHPKDSEAERKRDTGNTCEQWVAKCLKGVGKDIIDGKDKDEQADVKQACHPGFDCRGF